MLIRTIKFDLPAIIFQVEDTDNLGQDLKEALDTYRREFFTKPFELLVSNKLFSALQIQVINLLSLEKLIKAKGDLIWEGLRVKKANLPDYYFAILGKSLVETPFLKDHFLKFLGVW